VTVEQTTREKLKIIRANILADAIVRAVRWACFTAIVCGIAAPLAFDAWQANGIAAGLAVLALCVAMAWGVKPTGRSYGAQCRDVDERHPLE
jgi:hypothetical protein